MDDLIVYIFSWADYDDSDKVFVVDKNLDEAVKAFTVHINECYSGAVVRLLNEQTITLGDEPYDLIYRITQYPFVIGAAY